MNRLSALLAAGALLFACREGLAPTAPRLAPRDQAMIRDLLSDPIVQLRLGDLADRPTAERLRAGISDLLGLTATAAPDRIRESVDALQRMPEPPDPGDRLALDILRLTLEQVESVLAGSSVTTSSRARPL